MKRDEKSPKRPSQPRTGAGNRVAGVAKSFAREFVGPGPRGIHPALIPGVGVEQTGRVYRTDWLVFGVAAAFTLGFIGWGIFAGDHMSQTTQTVLNWVIEYMGVLFTTVATAILLFMLFLGISKYGRIKLGRDDEALTETFETASMPIIRAEDDAEQAASPDATSGVAAHTEPLRNEER